MVKITRKNDPKTSEKVYERDGYACILCGSNDIDIVHHVWYGAHTQYDKGRNGVDRKVTLCLGEHRPNGAHIGREANERCIKYLLDFYGEEYYIKQGIEI